MVPKDGTRKLVPVSGSKLPLREVNMADENRPKWTRSLLFVLLLQLITDDKIS